VVLLLIDLTRPIDEEDYQIIKTIKEYKMDKVILVLTKMDLSSARKVNEYKEQIAKTIDIQNTISISSKNKIGLNELLIAISNNLSEVDELITIPENDNFMISEIIREQVIFNTKQELPYATTVCVELNRYDNFTNTLNIQAVIIVEKESQKPILIGKNGSMIKKIGTLARKELLKIFDSKINLKLFVKVQKE
jgi:GTP-binding protein Era